MHIIFAGIRKLLAVAMQKKYFFKKKQEGKNSVLRSCEIRHLQRYRIFGTYGNVYIYFRTRFEPGKKAIA